MIPIIHVLGFLTKNLNFHYYRENPMFCGYVVRPNDLLVI